ncbi:MAG: LysR substrate-binding domain-containing protein [Geminicoccaceae bacterium]
MTLVDVNPRLGSDPSPIAQSQHGHGVRNLEIDLLRAFVAIVECGGFTRAVERVGRSQSAISLKIKRLEDLLGTTLFARSGRTIELTPSGEILIGYARRMLALNDEALSRLIEPEIEGVVRLGAPEDFSAKHLAPILARFKAEHPRVALEVKLDLTLKLIEDLERDELDLALIKREPQEAREGVLVWREPLVWIGAQHQRLSLGERLPLVLAPAPCVYRTRAIKALNEAGLGWHVTYTCSSLAGTCAAVRAGLGITVLPRHLAREGGLREFAPAEGLPPLVDTELALYRLSQRHGPALDLLANYIAQALEDDLRRC